MENIQQIKAKNPVETVIGKYVKLTQKGYRATGLCPFHADHHPSLQVDIRKQTFCCYACGEKGDVIEFVKKIEKCSFQEALAKLSPETLVTGTVLEVVRKKEEITVEVDHTPFLKSLMPYVAGHSELSPTYLDFEVGTAPMHSRHPMRGRIIFPIRDEEGSLKGFSGRSAEKTQSPKYLNTPTSEGYYRSQILYGLHRARPTVEETGVMYLTEGYKDAIAMHAAGFTGSVALGGTELCEPQLALIRRFAEKVYIVMDSDPPGQAAAGKILSQLTQSHIEAVNIVLPEGHDPDSFFREVGRREFEDYIRLNSSPPDRTELLLVTACMLYPEAKGYLGTNQPRPFVSLLPGILLRDEIVFRRKDHQAILLQLAEGTPWESLPDTLLPVATRLWEKWHSEVENQLSEWTQVKSGRREEALTAMMLCLLFRYSETRIVGIINSLVCRFHRIQDREERSGLLMQIAAWKELLTNISYRLDRPGYLNSNWIG